MPDEFVAAGVAGRDAANVVWRRGHFKCQPEGAGEAVGVSDNEGAGRRVSQSRDGLIAGDGRLVPELVAVLGAADVVGGHLRKIRHLSMSSRERMESSQETL